MNPVVVRILVAEKHPLLRRGLLSVFEDEPDLAVVAEAEEAERALALAEEKLPDVALVGHRLSDGSCLHVVRRLVERRPPLPALVFGTCRAQDWLRACLAAGASGYLLEDETPAQIVAAVRGAAAGQKGWLSREVAATLQAAWCDPLTPKELDVVHLLAEGHTAPEVAATLAISVRTARNHLNNIYGKLGLHSQPELVAWAWRTGLARSR